MAVEHVDRHEVVPLLARDVMDVDLPRPLCREQLGGEPAEDRLPVGGAVGERHQAAYADEQPPEA